MQVDIDEATYRSQLTASDLEMRDVVERVKHADEITRSMFLASLTPAESRRLAYCWRAWARPAQVAPPGDWRFWLVQAGRGFGKTKLAAEYVRDEVAAGRAGVIGLIGGDVGDVRDVMIEGPAGIIACTPPGERPVWIPSRRKLVWPNGAQALTFSSEDPEALRGPQHDLVWGDELARWAYPAETFSNLDFGLRLTGPDGTRPRGVFTTTPRPIKTLRELLDREDTVVTRGSTFDNAVNLAPSALASLRKRYEGTRLGRQELEAELLTDTQGALWTLQMIEDAYELGRTMDVAYARRIVVAVDPPVADRAAGEVVEDDEIAECGIIVAAEMPDERFLVLEDLSMQGSPSEWANVAVAGYKAWRADRLVAEANQGGAMVRSTIETVDRNVAIRLVHASEGKRTRAEPVAAFYERPRARVGHARAFPKLEDQCRTFTGRKGERSPDRHDALVWAITDLMGATGTSGLAFNPAIGRASNQWRI
jgi:phage terminase large subunit-like protein